MVHTYTYVGESREWSLKKKKKEKGWISWIRQRQDGGSLFLFLCFASICILLFFGLLLFARTTPWSKGEKNRVSIFCFALIWIGDLWAFQGWCVGCKGDTPLQKWKKKRGIIYTWEESKARHFRGSSFLHGMGIKTYGRLAFFFNMYDCTDDRLNVDPPPFSVPSQLSFPLFSLESLPLEKQIPTNRVYSREWLLSVYCVWNTQNANESIPAEKGNKRKQTETSQIKKFLRKMILPVFSKFILSQSR